jgi:hypothetical protein
MKNITKGTVSNKIIHATMREWRAVSDMRTMDTNHLLVLFNSKTGDQVFLPLPNWESFIVFMAESFALAEAEATQKQGNFEITLVVDKK